MAGQLFNTTIYAAQVAHQNQLQQLAGLAGATTAYPSHMAGSDGVGYVQQYYDYSDPTLLLLEGDE